MYKISSNYQPHHFIVIIASVILLKTVGCAQQQATVIIKTPVPKIHSEAQEPAKVNPHIQISPQIDSQAQISTKTGSQIQVPSQAKAKPKTQTPTEAHSQIKIPSQEKSKPHTPPQVDSQIKTPSQAISKIKTPAKVDLQIQVPSTTKSQIDLQITNNVKATPTASISGQVVGEKNNPEAGVWVIAQTNDLATPYTKIVVTDDNGLFVLPDMPDASYQIWVRGYGLKDSLKVRAKPRDKLRLKAKYPETPQEAAKIYPANYWYSLISPPVSSHFPGTGFRGNGIGATITTQEAWIDSMKQHCQQCHQLGTKQTREINHLDKIFKNSTDAWEYRLSLEFPTKGMNYHASLIGYNRLIKMYVDWSDRIAEGVIPPSPPRPKGVERNLVITQWDLGNKRNTAVHHKITADKRNPYVNTNDPIYSVAQNEGKLLITNPKNHTSKTVDIPIHKYIEGSDVHNLMMDAKSRIWITSRIRKNNNTPQWCQEHSNHLSARYFPLTRSSRQTSFYDPKTKHFKSVNTCYTTHQLRFASDKNSTLWFSGDKQVVGWLNTKMLDETGDEQKSQGWCPTVIDTNADGKITRPWNEPGNTINVNLDTRTDALRRASGDIVNKFIDNFSYGIIPNPIDGSVWITRPGPTPGSLVRLERGSNPPDTCKAEVYEPPFNNNITPRENWGYAPRGIDIDTKGVIWTALSGSGHLASFDRSKCKIINGPLATGQHCPEGWTLYPSPGPKMMGVDSTGSADFHYYNWVDQFNTLGLGKNIPIANGTSSDSLLALDPKTGKWVIMRVPYPLGFYTRDLDGRIEDSKAGWKGSAVYTNYAGFPTWHMEDGNKGNQPKILKFQFRPNPLAQ